MYKPSRVLVSSKTCNTETLLSNMHRQCLIGTLSVRKNVKLEGKGRLCSFLMWICG